MENIWLAFITGITTGGLSCFAVQGGLLTSSLAQNQEIDPAKSKKWTKVAMFIGSKLLAYTILGALLGLLGSRIAITPRLQGYLQIFAGIFMLATAARLLDLHPVFRYLTLQPPKWAYKLSRKTSQDPSFFAPAILGFLTVLLPCGITQAMMVLAVTTGNPLAGAVIMAAFILGTSPVFFALGLAAAEILKRKALKYVAALAVAVLGIISINTGQVLRGSPHTLANYYRVIFKSIRQTGTVAGINTQGQQEATIYVASNGYTSDVKSLKVNVPVKLTLVTNNTRSCARAFTIPQYNISRVLPPTGAETIEFTPTRIGILAYTCSMGMYTGSFNVIQ